ncbi:MAG: hypothetical protein IIV89_06685, partial [Bacteroidaceae bacterium]|nr:hypothetical protein [Bacteroidaceae bacterium]
MTVKRMINSYRSFKDGTLSNWQMGDGLDKCTQCGYYIVRISHRDVAAQGLPFVPADEKHYLVGHLFVSETGCDDKLQRGRGVAQTLLLNDCNNLRADVYCRSGACANGECFWDEWTRLVGNSDLNDVKSELEDKLQQCVDVGQVASLDGLVASGMYTGTFSNGDALLETFVLYVIDNFAAAGATSNVRSVSQFKYALNVDGTFSHKTRTGQGAKSIAWGNWVDLGAASTADIQDNSITAQKLSIDVREKVEKVPALEESVAKEKTALVNGDTVVGLTREVYSRQGKVDAATFLKRTTAGGTSISDGVASIRQIGGNIVKNLLGQINSIAVNVKYDISLANANVAITAKDNYIGDSASSTYIGIKTGKYFSGHKYYIAANCYSDVERKVSVSVGCNGYGVSGSMFYFPITGAGEWTYVSKLVELNIENPVPYFSIFPFGHVDEYIQAGVLVFAGGINIIDLTEMFGAGNEPTKEECDKMFGTMDTLPQGLTVAKPAEFKSVGYNQWNPVNLFTGKTVADNAIVDGDKSIAFFECLPCRVGAGENNGYVIGYGEGDEWSDEGIEVYLTPIYPMTGDGLLYAHKLEKDVATGTYVPKIKGYLLVVTPVTDKLCAHFHWSGDRAKTDYEEYVESVVTLPVIPQMSEWGLAGITARQRDTIDLEANRFTKRVGCVDLGSLSWVKMEATRFRTTGVNFNRVVSTVQLVCDKFTVLPTVHAKETYINAGVKDVIFPVSLDNDINIITSAEYESANSFKAAISGVMLYYELPTPEEFPITAKAAPNYVGCD